MAALNQDFITYSGNDVAPIFTVQTTAGVAVDISGATQIAWMVQRQDNSAIVLTKTKSLGQITFPSGGTDGRFQVAITKTDTATLGGFYIHSASLTDGSGNVTTVTVGRMQVGLAPTWTYDATQVSTNSMYQVRRLIGDVLYGDQQMQDEEINWFISNYASVWSAASAACLSLAAQFARMVDTVQGELRTLYSQRARNYTAMAAQLERQGKGRGSTYVYAGGVSQSDKDTQVQNPDRTPPQFNLMMFDDLLPESPVGHQTPGAPAPNTGP